MFIMSRRTSRFKGTPKSKPLGALAIPCQRRKDSHIHSDRLRHHARPRMRWPGCRRNDLAALRDHHGATHRRCAVDAIADGEFTRAEIIDLLAGQGNAHAMYLKGNMYFSGHGVESNLVAAAERYRRAMDGGYPDARLQYAHCLACIGATPRHCRTTSGRPSKMNCSATGSVTTNPDRPYEHPSDWAPFLLIGAPD